MICHIQNALKSIETIVVFIKTELNNVWNTGGGLSIETETVIIDINNEWNINFLLNIPFGIQHSEFFTCQSTSKTHFVYIG